MFKKLLAWFQNNVIYLGLNKVEVVKVVSNGSNKTTFYLNDPSSPSLKKEQQPPTKLALPVTVSGDSGPGFPLGSSQQQSSACKIVLDDALNYMLASFKTTNSPKKISRWAATSNLMVRPRAGVDINAYYDRGSLNFFYFNDKTVKKVIYTCDSHSVVTHEFGHAFLDILRPDFWSAQAPEVWAFHEAFGDMTALITCLQYDDLINAALKETSGNLMVSNVVSRLAAEMGRSIYNLSFDKTGLSQNSLRDLSVVFNYKIPESLPTDGFDNVLVNEPHSFSRVFSGAFYEIIVKIAKNISDSGKSPLDSLKIARDVASRYLIKATSEAPISNRLFDAIAKQMLLIDNAEGGRYQSILNNVFTSRQILLNKVLMLKNEDINSIKNSIKDSYELYLYNLVHE